MRTIPRGFTLVEAFVVMGIVGILTAVSYNAIQGINERSRYANTTNELLARLKQLRNEAFGRGAPTVLVLDKTLRRWWAIVDANGDFDLATFDPNTPAPGSDELISTRAMPEGFIIGPSDGYGQALPAPYAWVPRNTACTFCGDQRGSITFHANGTATLTGSSPNGGSFTVAYLTGAGRHAMTYAVIARTGAIMTFERFR